LKKRRESKHSNEPIVYHSDTTTIVPKSTDYNICYSWQEPLEEPTNKEILPHIRKLERT